MEAKGQRRIVTIKVVLPTMLLELPLHCHSCSKVR